MFFIGEPSAAALFGDADDISSEDEGKEKRKSDDEASDRRQDDEEEQDRRSDDENEQRPAVEDVIILML